MPGPFVWILLDLHAVLLNEVHLEQSMLDLWRGNREQSKFAAPFWFHLVLSLFYARKHETSSFTATYVCAGQQIVLVLYFSFSAITFHHTSVHIWGLQSKNVVIILSKNVLSRKKKCSAFRIVYAWSLNRKQKLVAPFLFILLVLSVFYACSLQAQSVQLYIKIQELSVQDNSVVF